MSSPVLSTPPDEGLRKERLAELGLDFDKFDFLVALAGNPNTGKSTLFNALTGLRQHTGNWPGKTVVRAEGTFENDGSRFKLVDLPGTYSLQAGSTDEEVARDFVLFGRPDVTVIVVDATRIERNLNLVFQILEITDRVVVCLNLMDEARRHGIAVNVDRLSEELGVPVIPAAVRQGEGIAEVIAAIGNMAEGKTETSPFRVATYPEAVGDAVREVEKSLDRSFSDLPNSRWVALRLLAGDESVIRSVRDGKVGYAENVERSWSADDDPLRAIEKADELRWSLASDFHDRIAETLYGEAERVTARIQKRGLSKLKFDMDNTLDRYLTSRWLGFPLMAAILGAVFWITIIGANVPSQMLATLLLDTIHPMLNRAADFMSIPGWFSGFWIDGVYLATAWVVSVMLPPMAIFFPIFTLLEDFGYLPRVAFNLDSLFRKCGAHGKQALTMCMGFGCNAAGVVATRVIDSPRERLIAIITNNFSLCNGRWPTQILIATIFIGALVPGRGAGLIAAGAVASIAVLGIAAMFGTSWLLSRTVLQGEATTFSLELPPYRPPRIMQTLYTSVIDRTLIILWRAIIFAAPAGAVIWLSANVNIGGVSIAESVIAALNPAGVLIGLNGVILLAYIVAIPANEIIVPTILMYTVLTAAGAATGTEAGVMFELDNASDIGAMLTAAGWTTLTGVNLMLFSLLHNPCSTTIYTIYRETKSAKWTTVATALPLGMGFLVCFLVAQFWRLAVG